MANKSTSKKTNKKTVGKKPAVKTVAKKPVAKKSTSKKSKVKIDPKYNPNGVTFLVSTAAVMILFMLALIVRM